jgi:hypothetical protein
MVVSPFRGAELAALGIIREELPKMQYSDFLMVGFER